MSSTPPPDDSARWFRRSLAAMAGIGLAIAIWQLQQLVLVIFASALVGLMLSDFAVFLQRLFKLPFALAIAAAVLIPLVALAIIFGLFGSLMIEQFIILSERLPAAVATVEGWIRATPVGADIMAQLSNYAPKVSQVVDFAQSALANIGSALTGLAVVLVAALYMAAQPRLYVDGLIDMLAPETRPRVREALGAVRHSLTAWLKGQAIGMAFVAVGTSLGLWLVGLPSALAIGLVAGLCEFVPYLGVVLVAVPTVILGFGQGVETGIFTIIAQPLHWLLAKLHALTGNWGWAIVLLVLIIKLLLFKLSEAQYKSFARMRAVQPRIEALKERYGDDRQKFQMAMMDLYKKEKINPVGGCLPILLQIPIFIALYWVLLESVELRHAVWIPGWIDNLTAKDPYFILPVLNAAAMWATQKLTPAPGMDPMQRKIMQMMPLAFGVMFAFFPAGLVLYWVTNGLLGLAQQVLITRLHGDKAKPVAAD